MAPPSVHAAALALRAAGTICPASPACPKDNGCALSQNGVTLQVGCGTDYYGGDLRRSQVFCSQTSQPRYVLTIAGFTTGGLYERLLMTTGCVAASYVGNNCYIKNIRNTGHADANVIGIAVTAGQQQPSASSGQQTCPASFACPENDGCLYTAGSRTLRLSCGVDFYGGDTHSYLTESLQACTQSCASDTDCIAASFLGGPGPGRCYLKGTRNDADFNDNVNAVYVVTASSSVSTSISSSNIPSTSVTPKPFAFTTCGSINSGANLVSNPSFERNGGARQPAQAWTSDDAYVYAVNEEQFAHCGTSYMVFLIEGQSTVQSLSQNISTALDTSKSYTIVFSFWPYWGGSTWGCSLDAYANDKRVFHRDVTFFSQETLEAPTNYETHTSASFIPASSDVTVRVLYTCTSLPRDEFSAILFDDVGLAPDQIDS
ncbi:hypothetical protein SVAN01_02042 [Stagonosporopsis vannaccii]|nr:hypothetical protein SVAN01_02042 [Stagonosporopsis vannaccii]